MRSFFKWVFVGVVVLALAGCSDGTLKGASGSLKSKLVVGDETITSVNYEITGSGIDLKGTISITSNPFTSVIGGIPVGTGYTITLTSPDGKCSGSATFDSVANQTSTATVAISCPNPRGAVDVNGTIAVCTTTITSVVASPAQVDVGGTINVNAAATDSGGGTVIYAWTATAGSFADATAASTTYTCSTSGTQTLTIKAGVASACNDSLSFDVSCGAVVAPVCGDGKVTGDETCDTKITTGSGVCPTAADCAAKTTDPCKPMTLDQPGTCKAACVAGTPITACVSGDNCCPKDATTGNPTCTNLQDSDCPVVVPVCGDGQVTGDEKCDTKITSGTGVCPTTATCTGGDACSPNKIVGSDCQAVCQAVPVAVAVCGDGCITSPETCEPPNTATCDANCKTITVCAAGVANCCGNGVVDTSIGETCDTLIVAGQTGACPTSCPSTDPCNPMKLDQAGTCKAACIAGTPITTCGGAGVKDGCCPANCNSTTDGDCISCNDMTGTWMAHVKVNGTITAPSPVGDQTDSNIDVVQRLVVTREGTNLNYRFDICSLNAGTNPGAAIPFATTYTPALIAALTTTGTGPDTCYNVTDTVAIPTFVINVGWDGPALLPNPLPTCTHIPTVSTAWVCPPAPPSTPLTCDGAIDSDGDGYYGVTLPTLVAGVIKVCAAAGLTITTELDHMVLTDATTNTGKTNFSTVGYVYGTDQSGTTGTGDIKVTPPPNVDVTSVKLPGDVSCADVIKHCASVPCTATIP